MDLMPVNIENSVVFNVTTICTSNSSDCRNCIDIGGSLHNWLIGNDVKYVIIDFQDEKEICSTFIIELIQLKKRLKMPFLFTGVNARTKKVFKDYNYFVNKDAYFFVTPEEAILFFKANFPVLETSKEMLSVIRFYELVSTFRAKMAYKQLEGEEIISDLEEMD